MVTRSKTTMRQSLKPKSEKMGKFRVTLIHKLGPYINSDEGMKDRERIKRKLRSARFTPMKVAKNGSVTFESKTELIEKFPANTPIKEIKAAIKANDPQVQVHVEKMEAY